MTREGERTGEVEVRPAGEVELSAPAWLSMGDRERYEAVVDDVSGSEFLDDRLRMVE